MKRGDFAVAAFVFLCFAAFALWRTPIPGVNEPQYLCKAKHFYAPEWCQRDMFLASTNAHWVFYALIGPLTKFATLSQTAFIARCLAWGGLAYAWVRLVRTLIPDRLAPIWSAGLFLALQAIGNLSGEWLIGGVEAKCFSYCALFLAIVAVCEQAYNRASLQIGLAISFHPVVGVWGLGALALALFPRIGSRENTGIVNSAAGEPSTAGQTADSANARSMSPNSKSKKRVQCAVLCTIAALPGLIPALGMIANAPSQEVSQQADQIQVFDRLDHHLDPEQFGLRGYAFYGVLLVAWGIALKISPQSKSAMLWNRILLGSLLIALGGLIVGFGPRNPMLMKFYPFRLFDLLLPMGTAIAVTACTVRWWSSSSQSIRLAGTLCGGILTVVSAVVVVKSPGRQWNPSGLHEPANWKSFVEACEWIEQNTPADALFLTQKMNVGFKWYAQRAEYVTWKDCPQDAAGIVEWKSRLDRITAWRAESEEEGFSPAEIARLAETTGVDYVLMWNIEPWQIEPVYRNRAYAVYRLAK